MLLTKSRYIAGVQCLKRLYLGVYSPELAVQPDDSDQSIIEQGLEVGLLARQMFPGSVTVDSRDQGEAIRATRELLANPEIPAIFESRQMEEQSSLSHECVPTTRLDIERLRR